MDEVETTIDFWKLDYNIERPHRSLNNHGSYEITTQYHKESKLRKP